MSPALGRILDIAIVGDEQQVATLARPHGQEPVDGTGPPRNCRGAPNRCGPSPGWRAQAWPRLHPS